MFITQDPNPNAYTRGVERAVIVVSTGLMDLMSDDELQAVLGHELGHVQAGHFLYSTALAYADRIGRIVSNLTPTIWDNLVLGIAATPAVLFWRRAGEITADRAGTIAAPQPEAMLSALMKLAGAPAARIRSASLEEFAQQAKDYERLMEKSLLRRIMMVEDVLYRGHPFPVARLGAGTDFLREGEYVRALRAAASNEPATHSEPCPHCGGSISDWDVVCRHCAWGIKRVDGVIEEGEEPLEADDADLAESLSDRGQQAATWVKKTAAPAVSESTKRASTKTAGWFRDRARNVRDILEEDDPGDKSD